MLIQFSLTLRESTKITKIVVVSIFFSFLVVSLKVICHLELAIKHQDMCLHFKFKLDFHHEMSARESSKQQYCIIDKQNFFEHNCPLYVERKSCRRFFGKWGVGDDFSHSIINGPATIFLTGYYRRFCLLPNR